ncbi:Hpt domain-containing protein, partial [Caulobacter sp. 17J65-9]|uniref:Hpt domain-containing protein n=1 Tax=Caulobacter sp. 17J65-9 TaxID=2709382 RepID=UPI0013C760FC|nr:chemotaxis protein CheA [Caulobacter sp. 17J65-9]
MDAFESIKATFFQECEELLADLETGLLAMEGGDADSETINAVFRAVHSVKGGAGAFGLDALVRFAHVFETLMDELRSGRMEVREEVVKSLLRAADVLSDHVGAARGGPEVDAGRSAALVEELEGWIGGDALGAADEDDGEIDGLVFQPMQVALADFGDAPGLPDLDALLPGPMALPDLDAPTATAVVAGADVWRVTFRPRADMYLKANESGLLLRELARLGETEVELDASNLPPLDQMAAEQAYLGWTVRLTGEVDEAAIREVFEWVEGDCDLEIVRADAAAAPALPELPVLDLPVLDLPPLDLAPAPAPMAPPLEPVAPAAPAADIEFDIAALIAKAQAAGPADTTAPAPA